MEEITHKRLLRRVEVERLTALKRSAIYQKVTDGLFPPPVRIGWRSVRWRCTDLLAWIENLESMEPEIGRVEARLSTEGRRQRGTHKVGTP